MRTICGRGYSGSGLLVSTKAAHGVINGACFICQAETVAAVVETRRQAQIFREQAKLRGMFIEYNSLAGKARLSMWHEMATRYDVEPSVAMRHRVPTATSTKAMKHVILSAITCLAMSSSVAFITGCASLSQSSNGTIRKASFGTMPDGTPVTIYTLRNASGMEARILNYGGIVQSLWVPDKNGSFGDVVLGYDNLDGYLTNSPYFGALIGRYGNRIARGTIHVEWREL